MKYQCYFCNQPFLTLNEWVTHFVKRYIFEKVKNPFQCSICSQNVTGFVCDHFKMYHSNICMFCLNYYDKSEAKYHGFCIDKVANEISLQKCLL